MANMGDKPLIVHVEDNPGDAMLVEEALAEAGIEVEVVLAVNAVELYRLMRSLTTKPDLVIIDLNLPVIPGHRVLQEIRHDREW
jgi:CheY-like chemotaxis protein